MKYPVIYTIAVLMLSWAFTYTIFLQPETINLYVFIMFIPALVALAINTWRYRSFKMVFRPITKKLNIKSIAFSIVYPIIFISLVAIGVYLFGLAKFDANKLSNLSHFPPLMGVLISFLLMFGEEYGWRGFLLNDVSKVKGKIYAAMFVGLVWALWHGPLIYMLAQHSGIENPALLTTVQMANVFIASFAFAFSYFLSGNIFPPMLFHFVWNYFNPIVLGNIYQNRAGIMEGNLILINGEGLAGIALGLVFVAWYIMRFRKEAVFS